MGSVTNGDDRGISELENKAIETIQSEQQKKKDLKS